MGGHKGAGSLCYHLCLGRSAGVPQYWLARLSWAPRPPSCPSFHPSSGPAPTWGIFVRRRMVGEAGSLQHFQHLLLPWAGTGETGERPPFALSTGMLLKHCWQLSWWHLRSFYGAFFQARRWVGDSDLPAVSRAEPRAGTQSTDWCLICLLRRRRFIARGLTGSTAEWSSLLMLTWFFVFLTVGGGTVPSWRETLAIYAAWGKCK